MNAFGGEANLALLAEVAARLGVLRESLVFVGGCATGLLVTAPRAQPIRMTLDVDLVAEVTTLAAYHALERQFEGLGFVHDVSAGAPICRWRMDNLVVDLMPSRSVILGFANPWYPMAIETAQRIALPETVLILQGPPGTGKTRLVRAILAAISRGKEAGARVLYTADKRALENDEIFVDFITGTHDAFVIEDADHILASRSKGNLDLHRFLAVADGVVRAQGRKIIFTTNLPNVGDIDDALLRPGRCFAVVRTRALAREETARLIERLHPDSTDRRDLALGVLFDAGERGATLAAIYRAAQQ